MIQYVQLQKAILKFRDLRTGNIREVPTSIGIDLIKWKNYSNIFRKKYCLPSIDKTDYIFHNPFTNKPYSYTQILKSWDRMRVDNEKILSYQDKKYPYTLSSLRNSYIKNHINSGTDLYQIKKLTGHSLDQLNYYFDKFG